MDTRSDPMPTSELATNTRASMCLSKHRYSTRIEAKISLKRCVEKRGGIFRVYQCPWCFGWHITKKEKWT